MCSVAPNRSIRLRVSRRCHGQVNTITTSRSATRSSICSGGAVGSISSSRVPSSIA
jgi:hypothetical protein